MSKRIMHIVGMPMPDKFGNLEKWFIKCGEEADKCGDEIFLVYENFKQLTPYEGKLSQLKMRVFCEDDMGGIIKLIKELNITSVVFHFKYEQYYSVARICKKLKIATYIILHCTCWYSDCDDWKRKLSSFIGSTFYRIKWHFRIWNYNKVFCVSKNVLNGYRNFFCWRENIMQVMYLGIDFNESYSDRATINNMRKGDEIVIGCVAFFGEIKGIDVLLLALKKILNKGYNVRLLHVGGFQEGNEVYKRKILEMAGSLHLNGNVVWLGTRNDVPDILKECDIYCQPSRSEALSLSIMEAMNEALPVVASNVGGIPELIKDGYNGYLFEACNSSDLVDKIVRLINDKNMRELMGARSKEIIHGECFNREFNIKRFLNLMK